MNVPPTQLSKKKMIVWLKQTTYQPVLGDPVRRDTDSRAKSGLGDVRDNGLDHVIFVEVGHQLPHLLLDFVLFRAVTCKV
jgi:hypothetical protein